jgi:hypothetical protein
MSYKEMEGQGQWKPENVGDKFEGIYQRKETRKGQNGDYGVHFFNEFETGVETFITGKVLDSKLEGAEKGDRILLTFKGEERGQGGNKYKNFSVMKWDNEDKPEL